MAETVAETDDRGSWVRLTIEVTPSNPWVVVELHSKGTGRSGEEVRWDDVAVATA